MAADKPRILHNNRDMMWSLIPLMVLCLIIAGIASQCSFSPGGPTAGPIPNFDVDAALTYDAQELGFPIRNPEVPEGWTPNSGSRSIVSGDRGGDSSTIGYITPPGRYIQLTQSDAGENALVGFVAGGPRTATGAEQLNGQSWVVYGAEDAEPIWISDFGDVRLLITGSASSEEFTELAVAAATPPLTP